MRGTVGVASSTTHSQDTEQWGVARGLEGTLDSAALQEESSVGPFQYRGVHLTPQLSKVVERVLGDYWLQYLDATRAYGPNQFTYTTKRGCKDLLLFELA